MARKARGKSAGANRAKTIAKSGGAIVAAGAKSPAASHLTVKGAGAMVTEGGKVSASDRAKAESLLSEIARRKQRIAEDFYEIGLALRDLSKQRMYVALGFSSFDALLTGRDVMGRTTAMRLVRLVSSMSRDEALAYGQEKASALLDYAKATSDVDTPKTLVQAGRLPNGKPIAEASVRDLKEAAKQVRAKSGKSPTRSPEARAAENEAKALRAWLRARGAAKAKVDAVRAKGGYVVRVEMALDVSGKLRAS